MNPKKSSVATDSRSRFTLSIHRFVVSLTALAAWHAQCYAANAGPVFLNVYGAQESIQGMNSASLCSLAGRYDNPIPTRLLAPIFCLKISAQAGTLIGDH
jgi:hypothetical protein